MSLDDLQKLLHELGYCADRVFFIQFRADGQILNEKYADLVDALALLPHSYGDGQHLRHESLIFGEGGGRLIIQPAPYIRQ